MVLLRPWLARHAMVRPKPARPLASRRRKAVHHSSGRDAGAVRISHAFLQDQGGVRAATVLLAVVGMIGDVRTLPAAVRLAMQCVASAP
jgi:hypothetical protein